MWKDYSQNTDKGKMEEYNDLLPDVNSFSFKVQAWNDRYSGEWWIKRS